MNTDVFCFTYPKLFFSGLFSIDLAKRILVTIIMRRIKYVNLLYFQMKFTILKSLSRLRGRLII
jgi:hypothetical protein